MCCYEIIDTITCCCNIYKYPVTNQETAIWHRKFSYTRIKYRFYSSVLYFSHIKPAVRAVHKAAVPSYISLILTAAFYTFLLAETTVMVTSLLLCFHHAVTALILNLTTVGTVVLTSSPGCFTPGKYTGTYWVGYWLGARKGLRD